MIPGYHKVLSFLHGRKRAYQLAMGSPAGEEVLKDLAKFCRADRSCFNADPRIHGVLEGRREVFLRIKQHLNLSPAQLAALYQAQFPLVGEDE